MNTPSNKAEDAAWDRYEENGVMDLEDQLDDALNGMCECPTTHDMEEIDSGLCSCCGGRL